jgi:hypothetical protein
MGKEGCEGFRVQSFYVLFVGLVDGHDGEADVGGEGKMQGTFVTRLRFI